MIRSTGPCIAEAPVLAIALLLTAVFAAACGDGDGSGAIRSVTIEPLASATARAVTPPAGIALGGKRAEPATATAEVRATATTVPDTAATEPQPAVADVTAAPTAMPANEPTPVSAPNAGRWIEVDVTNFVVRLMDGETVVREIAPVGVGVAIDTGAYASTQTGLFKVNAKNEALVYDAPYDTYISHWVGFDPERDNGFHSLLKDATGAVIDASTGRVSNGCIRTGEAEALFAFAEIGMPVWVHW